MARGQWAENTVLWNLQQICYQGTDYFSKVLVHVLVRGRQLISGSQKGQREQ